eukprot:scaffold4406_cov112-Isochrysis_galbana.AAC.9
MMQAQGRAIGRLQRQPVVVLWRRCPVEPRAIVGGGGRARGHYCAVPQVRTVGYQLRRCERTRSEAWHEADGPAACQRGQHQLKDRPSAIL